MSPSLASQIGAVSNRVELNQKAAEFGELARLAMLGSPNGGPLQALQLAQGANSSERVRSVLQKSATAPLGLSSDGAPLAAFADLAEGFLSTMRTASVFEKILADGGFRAIPARTRTYAITLSPNASRVMEAAMKPLTRLEVAGGGTLESIKSTSIVVISAELARSPLAGPIIIAELRAAVAAETDVLMFQELQSTGVPNQASAGNSAADTFTDLAFLLASVTTGARSRLYFVAAPDTMKLLSTRNAAGETAFPLLGPQGGTLLGTPAIVSDGLDSGVLALLDAQQICASDDGVRLATAEHASLALDTAPTAGSALTSLWQQNLVGLRAERWFSVSALPTANALAYITGIT